MIVLKTLRDPVWAAHPTYGVRVHIRRLTAQELRWARQLGMAAVSRLEDGLASLQPYGLDRPDGEGRYLNTADPLQMLRVGMLVETVETALLGVIAWEGVAGEDGQPAPINRLTLATLLQDDSFDRWLRYELEKAAQLLDLEKNVSGLSPNGGAGAGKTGSGLSTAEAATASASRARKGGRATRASAVPRPRTPH